MGLQVTQHSIWGHAERGAGNPYVLAHPGKKFDDYLNHVSPLPQYLRKFQSIQCLLHWFASLIPAADHIVLIEHRV